MQKVRLIVLLAVVCIIALSIPAFAQLATGGWPKYQCNYSNNGRTTATVIAKPYAEWSYDTGARLTRAGLVIDANHNVYGFPMWNTPITKLTSAGVVPSEWNWTAGYTVSGGTGNRNGLLLFDDGVYQRIIFGPGRSASDATMGHAFAADMTGALALTSDACTAWFSSNNNSYTSPAVGVDGTIYTHAQNSTYSNDAPIVALNSDMTTKWTFNAPSASGMENLGFGGINGALAVQRIPENGSVPAHNRIFVSGTDHFDSYELCYRRVRHNYQVVAIDDMGDHAELIWGAYNPCYSYGPPSISNDGNTIYVTGGNVWTYSDYHPYDGGVYKAYTYNTLVAYDSAIGGNRSIVENQKVPGDGVVTDGRADSSFYAGNEYSIYDNPYSEDWITNYKDTGGPKWKLNTGTQSIFPPAIGADGTLYVASSFLYDNVISAQGKVVAVNDKGDHGEIKWSLDLPDDGSSECSNIAVLNTNPAILYVAAGDGSLGGGRIYCIEDEGTYGKILWSYQGISDAAGTWPCYLAVDTNGDLYIAFRQFIKKFPAGFDRSNPNGISGYVKDNGGKPIANAWVAASTSANPLTYDADRIRTRTNADGYYQLGVNDAGTYYVAATAPDYEGSADASVTLNAASDVVKQDFTLKVAGYNQALAASASCSNADASYPAANVVDGDYGSRFKSTGLPAVLDIDLGATKTINEVAFYWELDYGNAFTIEYSDDNTNWNTAANITAANGGFPLDWYIYTNYTNTTAPQMKIGYNVIKIPAVSARYWKINVTGGRTSDVSIWEVELRDAEKQGPTNISINLGDAKSSDNGSPVRLASAVVTATDGGVPANTIFIESADRTSGIRVNYSDTSGICFGDKVSVLGKVYTDANNEKYINAVELSKQSDGAPLQALGMNNKAAAEDKAQGLFIKTWGKVSAVDTDSFTISDGSSTAIKVLCGSTNKPSIGDSVRVRGVAGKGDSGPVLYMRGDRCDWTTADAAYQALPFSGEYKYPTEYLVLGPYTPDQPTSTYWSDWLFSDYYPEYDFISVATNGAMTEAGLSQPKAGDNVGDKTWVKAYTSDGKLDLNSVFGGTIEHAVTYVYLNVWSEIDNPAVGLTTGSDDWLRVYVNGVDVRDISQDATITDAENNDLTAGRGCNYGDDLPVAITLHKGSNNILFKVVNGGSGFGVTCQFVPAGATGTYGYGGYDPYTTTGLGYITNIAH